MADLIASLCIHTPDARVLDPCAGEGALLQAAGRRLAALGAGDGHRQLFGIEIDPATALRCREHLSESAGVSSDQVQVACADFLALEADGEVLGLEPVPPGIGEIGGLLGSFDVGVMNPPYTRQERLAVGLKRGANGLGARAGLHAHFLVHLARCVRPGGWLGIITPGTWLTAEYGRAVRAFLREQFRIHALLDFARDVFPDANVEACIALLEKCPGPEQAEARAATTVRFIHLRAGADPVQAVPEALACAQPVEQEAYRVQPVPQSALAAEERWSRFFLTPPRVGDLCHAPGASDPTMVPLETLARIARGITTGNNALFLPDAETIGRWGIEDAFLHPIVRSPRDIPGLDTTGIGEPARLLVVPPGPEGQRSRAAAYLRARGGEKAVSLGGRLPAPAPLLFGYAVRARKAFFRNSAALLAGDNFHCLAPRREDDLAFLFALLNAVPVALLLETQGRGQGRGLLKIQRYELAALRVPDPARLDSGLRRELEAAGEALCRAPDVELARTELDRLAARAYGRDAAGLRRAERELALARQGRRELFAPTPKVPGCTRGNA